MKRYLIIILAVCGVTATAYAQNTISQQIEVTREFRPDVARAFKLDIPPRTTDTVSLRPVIDYSITPTPWNTTFDTRPINPIRISAAEYNTMWPYYLRAGGGVPGMTLLDFYATARLNKSAYMGAYVNHYGEYAKLANDLGEKLPSGRMNNAVGAYFGKNYGRRNLDVSVDFDNRSVSPFGAFSLDQAPLSAYYPENIDRIRYNDISGEVSFGDLFQDFSLFNWKLGVGGGYFTDNSGYGQAGLKLDGGIGTALGKGRLILGAGADLKFGQKEFRDYSNTTVTLAPRYGFSSNGVNITIGLKLAYDSYGDSSEFHVFPDIEVAYAVTNSLSAYIKADGGLGDGSYRSLSYMNPYITGGDWLKNSSRIGARVGLLGAIFPHFTYDIYGGIDSYEDYHALANVYAEGNTTRFTVLTDVDPTIFFAGVMLKAGIAPGLELDLSGKIYGTGKIKHELWADSPAIGIPSYEVDAGIRYSYKEKLFLSLGCEFTGKRIVSVLEPGYSAPSLYTETLPSTANLKAGAEFRLMGNLNLFITAENLLNQRIYRFNHYPVMGINVLAGVKMVF